MARGIVLAGSRTSSPRVAIRAYPAKAKNSSPADCSTASGLASNPSDATPVEPASGPTTPEPTTTARTSRTATTITPGRRRGAGDPEAVGHDHQGDRERGDRTTPLGRCRIRGEGDRHGCGARRLAHHEAPSGGEAPPRPDEFAAVEVGAAGRGSCAASCADDIALQQATTAAMTSPMSSPAPATCAAGWNTAKTPAPIIEPRPMNTAALVPRRRCSRGSLTRSR